MAMSYRDACQALKVKPSAKPEDIKRAYRSLARQLHPDHNPGPLAAEQFAEISEAYRTLTAASGATRATVRVPDSAPVPSSPARPAHSRPSEEQAASMDLLEGRKPRNVPVNGQDVIGDLYLTLSEVFTGTNAAINFDDLAPCTSCGGQGGAAGAKPVSCPACGGRDGSCIWCEGIGRLAQSACSECEGQGTVTVSREVQMSVQPGVEDGDELNSLNEGRWGAGTSGNLLLTVHIEMPDGTRRDGYDLYQDLPVGILEAVLGGKAPVRLLNGQQTALHIKAGTSSGKRLRLKGRGLPKPDGTSGDLYAVVMITAPEQLSEREKLLYEQLLAEAVHSS
jgi:molecular chaperone DnaJ